MKENWTTGNASMHLKKQKVQNANQIENIYWCTRNDEKVKVPFQLFRKDFNLREVLLDTNSPL